MQLRLEIRGPSGLPSARPDPPRLFTVAEHEHIPDIFGEAVLTFGSSERARSWIGTAHTALAGTRSMDLAGSEKAVRCRETN